jgi:hypothetical protein
LCWHAIFRQVIHLQLARELDAGDERMLAGSQEAPCPDSEGNNGFEGDDRWDHLLNPDDVVEHLHRTNAETEVAHRLLDESAARWHRARSPLLPRRAFMRHFARKERRLQRHAQFLRSRRIDRGRHLGAPRGRRRGGLGDERVGSPSTRIADRTRTREPPKALH